MPTPLTSWKSSFPDDVILDSGVLYIGSTAFSAQEGGLKFDPGREMRHATFDGEAAPVAGLDRTTAWKSMISGVVLQMPSTAIATLEPGGATGSLSGAPSGVTAQMFAKAAGVLYAAGDYISNVRAIWMRGDGTYVQIRFPKGLCNKWGLAGTDKQEGKIEIEIEARLDMTASGATVKQQPYVIEYFATAP